MKALDAKIRVPMVPEWAIPRPRLAERVLESPARVVLFEGPAGFGKSVLAAQVCAAGEMPVAWLHVDRADGDPRRFCSHLIAALGEAVPALARTELPGQVDAAAFHADLWLEDVLLFLPRGMQEDARLVLDNLEPVLGDAAAVGLLERLVMYGPARLKILLTSRTRPPFGLARLAERGEALVFTSDDLAFDQAEFEQAARARGATRAGLSIAAWWARTGGWPVALGLDRPGSATVPGAGADARRGYVEDEILGRLPPDLLGLLRRTCLFGSLSAESLRAAGEMACEYGAFLSGIAAAGVPHMRLAGDGVLVHPWIRELLLGSVRGTAEAEAAAGAASHWYVAQNRYDLAVGAWIEVGLPARALELIEAEGDRILALNLAPQIEQWIEPLSAEWRFHPLYATCLTRSYVATGKLRQLAAYLDALRPHAARIEASPQYRAVWKATIHARQATARGQGYLEIAAQWASMRAEGQEASVGIEVALGIAALYELRFDESVRHFQVARDLSKDHRRTCVDLLGAMGVVLVERGRPREALALFEQMLAESDAGSDQRPFALLNIASVRRDEGRFRDVLAAVASSAAASRETGVAVYHTLPHVHYFRGESFWNLGRRTEAVAELEMAWTAFQDNSRFDGLSAGATLDHYRTLMGERADRVADDDFDAAPLCEARIRHLIGTSRRCAMQGDMRGARERAALAREIAADMPHMQATAWFTEGWAESRCGMDEAASAALRHGLTILETLDRATYPMADPELTAWVVAQSVASATMIEAALKLTRTDAVIDLHGAFAQAIQRAGVSAEQVERLAGHASRLNVRGLEAVLAAAERATVQVREAYAASVRDLPPPPLRVTLLGAFQCVWAGGEIRFPRKASRRIFELLLLEHPRPVHEERLIEALWPNSDPARGRHRLQTAVNDLRRAVDPHGRAHGPTAITYRDEHYRLKLPAGSWVDYHALRERLDALNRTTDSVTPGEALESARAVLDDHTGDLLADAPYAEEAAEPREQLRTRLLGCVATLLRPAVQDGREPALPLIERALEVDSLWEEGVGMRIELLRKLGRPVAALRAYGDYEARLQRELGVSPNEKMRALVNSEGPF